MATILRCSLFLALISCGKENVKENNNNNDQLSLDQITYLCTNTCVVNSITIEVNVENVAENMTSKILQCLVLPDTIKNCQETYTIQECMQDINTQILKTKQQ